MLAAWILVARILGKTIYGELGIIQSTISMFGVFAGFGLGMTATKHVAELRYSDIERTGRIIRFSGLVAALTGGVMAVGLLITAPWLAGHTLNAPHLTGPLRISSLILLMSAINGSQTGALSGFEAFKTIARVNLYTGLLSFPIVLVGAHFRGLNGAVWALVVNLGINGLLNHVALHKTMEDFSISPVRSSLAQELPLLWSFSLPAVLAGAMVGPVNWICKAILVNRPSGYGEMGILSAADQWQNMLLFLPGLLNGVILPVLSERLGQQDTKTSISTLVLAIKANAFLVIPVAVIACFISPQLMGLNGNEFRAGWPTLVCVLCATILMAVNGPIGQIIAAAGKMWIGFLLNLVWGLTMILGTIVFINKGSFGLALARAGSYVLHTVWGSLLIYYLVKSSPQRKPMGLSPH